MRSKFALVAFSFFIGATVVACRKHKEDVPVLTPAGTHLSKELGNKSLAETQQALEGKWYLLGSSGGIAGQSTKSSGVYHAFGKTVFTVNDNGNVTEYKNTWQQVRSIHSGDTVYRMSHKSDPVGITFLRIINDTLYTSDNSYDGFGREYIKIK